MPTSPEIRNIQAIIDLERETRDKRSRLALAERAGIDLASIDPRLDQLRNQTDVQRLAAVLDTELSSVEAPGGQVRNSTVKRQPEKDH